MYGSLRPLVSPLVEPVSLDLARAHCRIDHAYDDELLAGYVSSARVLAEQWLNRCLITQTVRYAVTSAPPPSAGAFVQSSLLVFPMHWPPYTKRPLMLPGGTVSQVLEVNTGPIDDMTPADPSTYTVNLATEPAQLLMGPDFMPVTPHSSLNVSYVAGYSDNPADVPAPIRTGILLLTAAFYEGRGDSDLKLPDAAWAIMAPYRLWQFAG